MPERGPVQFLLPLLSSLARTGRRLGLSLLVVGGLLLIARPEGFSQSGIAQSVRQAVWDRAIAQDATPVSWPWSETVPPMSSIVPRLGVSAAVFAGERSETTDRNLSREARASVVVGGRDPHLSADDLAVGDRITVTTASGRTLDYRVTGRERLQGEESAVLTDTEEGADPHCASSADAAARRLIIETIEFDAPKSATPAKSTDSKV